MIHFHEEQIHGSQAVRMFGGYEWRSAERSEIGDSRLMIGESHLTLSEVSMRGQRRLQSRKESRRPRQGQD